MHEAQPHVPEGCDHAAASGLSLSEFRVQSCISYCMHCSTTSCAHSVSPATFGKCRRGVISHMQDGGLKASAVLRSDSACVFLLRLACQPCLFCSSSVCLFSADRCELIASVTTYHNMLELLDIHQCYTARPRSESCDKRQRTKPIAEHVQPTACSRLLSR